MKIYSITASTRARNIGGKTKPRAFLNKLQLGSGSPACRRPMRGTACAPGRQRDGGGRKQEMLPSHVSMALQSPNGIVATRRVSAGAGSAGQVVLVVLPRTAF